MAVFSEIEKQGIISEFEHYNRKKERVFSDEDGSQPILTDPFAE